MKKRILIVCLVFVLLPISIMFSGCLFDDDEKYNYETTQTKNVVQINLFDQNGNSLNKNYQIDFDNVWLCPFIVENGMYYETSGYYTELNGQGISVYNYIGEFSIEFKSFCEGKSSVNVYEYKVGKTYNLTLSYGTSSITWKKYVGDSFSLPTKEKYGYEFLGYSEVPNSESYVFNSVSAGKFTEDVTLYAIYRPISFQLFYSTMPTNPGYCDQYKTVKFGESIVLPMSNIDGYNFHGFYTQPYGQGEKICDKDGQFTINFLPDESNFYMYAYYTEAQTQSVIYDNLNIDTTMTVRYKGYYADNVEEIITRQYSEGDIIECLEPESRAGYYFDGWYNGNQRYNFEKSTETSKNITLTAKFIKTDYNLFSNIKSLTLSGLAYNQAHKYSYVYDCESGQVSFSGNFSIYSSSCSAILSVTVNKTLVYSNEINSGESFSGSFSANRGDIIVISSYVTENASNGTISMNFSNVDKLPTSIRVVDRPSEFSIYITEGNDFEIEYCPSIDNKTFVGYYTGENGKGVKLTDSNGKSIVSWEILENNHYYKPYEDYNVSEDDFGVKIYAYYN